MLVWNSRAQRMRNGSLAPLISKALAMPQDLAPPRPPYATLYRDGLNKPCSLMGNSALAMALATSDNLNPSYLLVAPIWQGLGAIQQRKKPNGANPFPPTRMGTMSGGALLERLPSLRLPFATIPMRVVTQASQMSPEYL